MCVLTGWATFALIDFLTVTQMAKVNKRSRSHGLFLVLGLDWGCYVHTAKSCDGQAREPWSGTRKKKTGLC